MAKYAVIENLSDHVSEADAKTACLQHLASIAERDRVTFGPVGFEPAIDGTMIRAVAHTTA